MASGTRVNESSPVGIWVSECLAEISAVISVAACSWPLSEATRIRAISSHCDGTPESEACPMKERKRKRTPCLC